MSEPFKKTLMVAQTTAPGCESAKKVLTMAKPAVEDKSLESQGIGTKVVLYIHNDHSCITNFITKNVFDVFTHDVKFHKYAIHQIEQELVESVCDSMYAYMVDGSIRTHWTEMWEDIKIKSQKSKWEVNSILNNIEKFSWYKFYSSADYEPVGDDYIEVAFDEDEERFEGIKKELEMARETSKSNYSKGHKKQKIQN